MPKDNCYSEREKLVIDLYKNQNKNMREIIILFQTFNMCKEEEQIPQLQGEENRPQHKFQDESNNTSSKKDSREEVEKEREEAKRRILEENPDISKDALEFVLSLPFEKKIPKVTELETIHATAEQQEEEMERLLKKNNKE